MLWWACQMTGSLLCSCGPTRTICLTDGSDVFCLPLKGTRSYWYSVCPLKQCGTEELSPLCSLCFSVKNSEYRLTLHEDPIEVLLNLVMHYKINVWVLLQPKCIHLNPPRQWCRTVISCMSPSVQYRLLMVLYVCVIYLHLNFKAWNCRKKFDESNIWDRTAWCISPCLTIPGREVGLKECWWLSVSHCKIALEESSGTSIISLQINKSTVRGKGQQLVFVSLWVLVHGLLSAVEW